MKIREISDRTDEPVTDTEWNILNSGAAPSDFDDTSYADEKTNRTIEYEMIEVKEKEADESDPNSNVDGSSKKKSKALAIANIVVGDADTPGNQLK